MTYIAIVLTVHTIIGLLAFIRQCVGGGQAQKMRREQWEEMQRQYEFLRRG